MASVTVSVRGLGGSKSLTLDGENITAEDVRIAAEVAEGLVLRTNGSTITDLANTPVENGQTFVTAPPEAKHG